MALLRRTKSIPLVPPAPTVGQVLLPEPKILRKRGADVGRMTDLAVERAQTIEPAAGTAKFAELFAILLAPFAGEPVEGEMNQEELERRAEPVRQLLERSARFGTAFAEVEATECGTQPGRSDPAIDVALRIASYVQTQLGPEDVRAGLSFTVLATYYLARVGVDPVQLARDHRGILPTLQDLAENLPRASAVHPAMVSMMQAMWDANVPG